MRDDQADSRELVVVKPGDVRCDALPKFGPAVRCDRIDGHPDQHVAWSFRQGRPAMSRVWFGRKLAT